MDLETFLSSFVNIGHAKYVHVMRKPMEFAKVYKPRAVDRFVVSYPKSGTAWTQQIIQLLINSGRLEEKDKFFFDKYYFEIKGQEILQTQASEQSNDVFVMKTHLCYELLPFNESAKYLLVLRNPKDVILSKYKMAKMRLDLKFDFHVYFKHWITGNLDFGDYFKFVKHFWIHYKNEKNFSILVYEEMKRDIKPSIETIAQFLGQKYVNRLSNDDKLMDQIIQKSSFDSMKEFHTNDFHMRKGIVGDWRSVLTKDESDLIDKRVEEEWMGTGLELLWKEEMKWIEK